MQPFLPQPESPLPQSYMSVIRVFHASDDTLDVNLVGLARGGRHAASTYNAVAAS